MSLIPVFNSIKARLLAKVANTAPFTQTVTTENTLSYVQLWNNQLAKWLDNFIAQELKDLEQTTNNLTSMYPVAYPAILIEFDNVVTTQLGNGCQIYDDLIVRVHIIHHQIDAGDGTMEQNVEVYALQDAVYAALQKFLPAGCVEFIRQRHQLDWNHGNLYHYIVEYGTNYVDTLRNEPVEGVSKSGVTPDINIVYNPPPFIKP